MRIVSGFFADLATVLSLTNEMPVVMVGIGYPVGGDIRYVLDRRTHDLIEPTADGPFATAGGPAFFRFITDELWPWLAARYPVSEDRTLGGHSFGVSSPCGRCSITTGSSTATSSGVRSTSRRVPRFLGTKSTMPPGTTTSMPSSTTPAAP